MTVPEHASVTIDLFDLLGNKVLSRRLGEVSHTALFPFDLQTMLAGHYEAVVHAGETVVTVPLEVWH
jgi:hypothetical protein